MHHGVFTGVFRVKQLCFCIKTNNAAKLHFFFELRKRLKKKSVFFRSMLSIACSFIFVMTLFGRVKGNHGITVKPFESYLHAFSSNNAEQQLQIIMNIVMYIPFGILLPYCFRNLEKCRRVIFIALICSISIEMIQRLFCIGLFEVDDIINNVLGATIGVFIYKLTIKIPDVFMNIVKMISQKKCEKRFNMNTLKLYHIQMLDLVSISLFGGEKCDAPLSSEVLKEANSQAVLTLMKVDKETSPDFYLLHAQNLVNNVRIDCEHTEAHRLMTETNIPYVILKGSASASYYPEPMLRTMGDVDLMIAKSDLPRADVVLRENGFHPVEKNDNECHLEYHRRTYGASSTWEVHWKPNGIPDGKEGVEIQEYLADIITSAKKHSVSDGEYMLPTAFHHGLVMLLHVAGHLINTGIGLRHLCDWAVFVAKFSDEEFCEMFEDKLKAVGLWRFAQLLTQLSVKYLHCPAKEWCGVGDDDYLEMMMVDIMNGGNFGVKDKNRINQAKLMTNTGKGNVDDTSLLKQLFLTMNEKARRGMPITTKVPLLLPIGWIYVGGRHLVRIAQGRRPSIDVADMIAGATERKEIYKEFRLFEAEKK